MEKIITVLLAGIIGYFTNYIAIKMLFIPRKEIKLFNKYKVPFTPGIIPKNRKRIQESLSNSINESLLNKEILKENIIKSINENNTINNLLNDLTVNDLLLKFTNEECILSLENNIKNDISNAILNKYNNEDLGQVFVDKIFESLFKNNMMLMAFIGGLKPVAKTKLDEIVNNNLSNYIDEFLSDYINNLKDKKINNLEFINNNKDIILNKLIDELLSNIDIKSIIYNKTEALDIVEFENLLLKIIKKELRMITYLGGVLGILIGLLNLLIL